ncbi:hypothetical protein Y695_03951 [Hydrogenophaga sp. T4]|nr:hypothetical protein Y695_03951 [Hydrogenophaga sp. T4]
MKGDRLALSGWKPLAATAPIRTSLDRMVSMITSSNRVQAMKPSRASSEGDMVGSSGWVDGTATGEGQPT